MALVLKTSGRKPSQVRILHPPPVFNMKGPNIILTSFLQALGVFIYILLVVQIISALTHLFPEPDQFWQPVILLLLFVVSVAITGLLVLAKPIILYLDGLKKEAIKLFGWTIGWLILTGVIVFVFLVTLG